MVGAGAGGGGAAGGSAKVWMAPLTEDGVGAFEELASLPAPVEDNRLVVVSVPPESDED